MSRTGTMPTRSNSLRAMIENSASPLAPAIDPITAEEAEISPATGACNTCNPPSGSVSRASVCPAVTVSPGSARISDTFSPCRSGRTEVSSRAIRIPDTSTILPKQAFAALNTVTAAPFGGGSSSAAKAGVARRRRAAIRSDRFRERVGAARWGIGGPVQFLGLSISEGGRGGQGARPVGHAFLDTRRASALALRLENSRNERPDRSQAAIFPATVSAPSSLTEHSQTTATLQPSFRRASRFRLSRFTVSPNFVFQKFMLDAGLVQNAQCWCRCQKQPCTSITARCLGNTACKRLALHDRQ